MKECDDPLARARRTGALTGTTPSEPASEATILPATGPVTDSNIKGSTLVIPSPSSNLDMTESSDPIDWKISDSTRDLDTCGTNDCAPTYGMEDGTTSALPSIPEPPEDIPSMLLHAMDDVVTSIPRMVVGSWKNNMLKSIWNKMNPSRNQNSSPQTNQPAQESNQVRSAASRIYDEFIPQLDSIKEQREKEEQEYRKRIEDIQREIVEFQRNTQHEINEQKDKAKEESQEKYDSTKTDSNPSNDDLNPSGTSVISNAVPIETISSASPHEIVTGTHTMTEAKEPPKAIMFDESTKTETTRAVPSEADSKTLTPSMPATPSAPTPIQPRNIETIERKGCNSFAVAASSETKPEAPSKADESDDTPLKVLWIVNGIAIGILIFAPLLRGWKFKPLNSATQQFDALPLINPRRVIIRHAESILTQDYARVNDPNGTAIF
jgi:hypothetical protein